MSSAPPKRDLNLGDLNALKLGIASNTWK